MSHLYRMSVRRAAALAGAVAITASLTAAAGGTSSAEAATFPSITAGGAHTCAIKTNDTATCWGYNGLGQASAPTDLGTVKQITAGGSHTCAIKTNDTVACWGYNGDGQASVPTDLGTVKQITGGDAHTCAIKTNDTVACWGYNYYGQASVPTDLGTVKQITAGGYHTCAIKTNDTVVCWGWNDYGQATVPTDLGTVKQITAGYVHTCAIKTNDTATCWGYNYNGQASVPTDLGTVKQITGGGYHTCATKTNDTVVCWGDNTLGATSVPAELTVAPDLTKPSTPGPFTGVPSSSTTSTTATIGFTLGESGGAVECRLDSGSWGPCTNVVGTSGSHTVSGLSLGSHKVSVRQTDTANNTSDTGTSSSWTITAPVAPTVLTPAAGVKTLLRNAATNTWTIKVSLLFSTGGDTRPGAQFLTLQVAVDSNGKPVTTKPADGAPFPTAPAITQGVVNWSGTGDAKLTWASTPVWVRIQNKFGKWSNWARLTA